MAGYRSILCISDQHFPYNHPDICPFLKAIANKYSPDKIVNMGDELDYHAISFHDKDPELMGPSDELKTAIARMSPLFDLFPTMDIIESNHGSLVYRKAKHHGIPRHVMKSYREVIGAPQGWRWHPDLTLKMSDGNNVYLCHGRSSNGLKLSQSLGMSTVQGHFHSKFEIQYWGNSIGLYWSMVSGCLIEKDSLAFAYGKLDLFKPIIGTSIILNGVPKLLPMILTKAGRWNGLIP